jgi:predicted dinucleotide-binding enzyme
MNCVASVRIDDQTVTVALSCSEKIEALHGDLTVPRTAVVRARAVPDGLAEVHGQHMATGWPGVSTAGTVRDLARDFDIATFAVCHGRRPAVVLDLADQPYDRIVVTVGNPDQIVSRLT